MSEVIDVKREKAYLAQLKLRCDFCFGILARQHHGVGENGSGSKTSYVTSCGAKKEPGGNSLFIGLIAFELSPLKTSPMLHHLSAATTWGSISRHRNQHLNTQKTRPTLWSHMEVLKSFQEN